MPIRLSCEGRLKWPHPGSETGPGGGPRGQEMGGGGGVLSWCHNWSLTLLWSYWLL